MEHKGSMNISVSRDRNTLRAWPKELLSLSSLCDRCVMGDRPRLLHSTQQAGRQASCLYAEGPQYRLVGTSRHTTHPGAAMLLLSQWSQQRGCVLISSSSSTHRGCIHAAHRQKPRSQHLQQPCDGGAAPQHTVQLHSGVRQQARRVRLFHTC